jgi:hypothetical protein
MLLRRVGIFICGGNSVQFVGNEGGGVIPELQ